MNALIYIPELLHYHQILLDLLSKNYSKVNIVIGNKKNYESIRSKLIIRSNFIFGVTTKIDDVYIVGYSTLQALKLIYKYRKNKKILLSDSNIFDKPISFFRFFIKRFLINQFDYYLVPGKAAAYTLMAYGVDFKNIYYGLNASINSNIILSNDKIKDNVDILVVARFIKDKNHRIIFKAISNINLKLNITFLGWGPELSFYKKISKELIHNINFEIVDNSKIKDYYQKSKMLILASHYEPWGIAAEEALKFGCPVLASSKVTSSLELLIPGINGYFFDRFDSEDLKNKILKLLNSNLKRSEVISSIVWYRKKNVLNDSIKSIANI